MIREYEKYDDRGDISKIVYTGKDGYTYVVHHVYEPDTATDEWMGVSDVLENVYNSREDKTHSSYSDWLYRLHRVVKQGNCILVYKYSSCTQGIMVGLSILHEVNALHYGRTLSVFGVYNHEGNAKGFYDIYKEICRDADIHMISRVKYIAPYRYMQIYTKV